MLELLHRPWPIDHSTTTPMVHIEQLQCKVRCHCVAPMQRTCYWTRELMGSCGHGPQRLLRSESTQSRKEAFLNTSDVSKDTVISKQEQAANQILRDVLTAITVKTTTIGSTTRPAGRKGLAEAIWRVALQPNQMPSRALFFIP